MLKVAILDDYQNVSRATGDWSRLDGRADVTVFNDHVDDRDIDRLVERLKGFDCIVVMRERTRFGRDLLSRLSALRFLVTTGGVNAAIDVEAAASLGIPVSATRSVPYPTAELTWALILALVRRIIPESRSLMAGGWQSGVGGRLRGDTLGVLGLGRIGGAVARIGVAFGMDVIAWSQNITAERCAEYGVNLAPSKEELFTRSDVLTIHLGMSERTRGIVGAKEFAAMKKTAYLINTARSPIVDEAALIEALRGGGIAGAAIDVYEREPLAPDHPFRTLDTLLMTPHIGYVTKETYQIYFDDVIEDIDAWLSGAPVRLLNAPAKA